MKDIRFIYRQKGIDPLYKTWHKQDEDVLLIYTYSDGGSIVFGDCMYPIKSGALCFIGSQKYHYTAPDRPEEYERTKILLPIGDFMHLRRMMGADEGYLHRFTADSAVYALLPQEAQEKVEQMLSDLHESAPTYIKTETLVCFMRLLSLLDRYGIAEIPSPDGAIMQTVYYIHLHLFSPLSVDELSKAAHMSKYYFCHRFKEKTGASPMEYIKSTRLAVARQLLEESSLTVSQIAERCGFTSCSYFCRIFKERLGVTAYTYRRTHTN